MLYAEERYGVFRYGDDTQQQKEEREIRYWVDLSRYVPEFVSELREMAAIYDAQGYECGRAAKTFDEIFLSNFVRDCPVWGLQRWEQLLALTVNEKDTEDQRRSNIIAKLISVHMCTADVIKQVVEEITGVTCVVQELPEQYKFIIKFVGKYGVVRSTKAVTTRVNEIKPAHLDYEIQFKWVTWGDVNSMTWSDVSRYTWEGLLILETVTQVTWGGINEEEFTWRDIHSHTWKNIADLEEAKRA